MNLKENFDKMVNNYYIPFDLNNKDTNVDECIQAMPKELKELFSYVYGSTMDHPAVIDKQPRKVFEGLALQTFASMKKLARRIEKRERRRAREEQESHDTVY